MISFRGECMDPRKNYNLWSNSWFNNTEKPIPEDIYPVIDNDLARDNLENDIPAADFLDL